MKSFFICALLVLVAVPVTSTAQAQPKTLKDAKRIVVMINGKGKRENSVGAGVIMGVVDGYAYVLSAMHVMVDSKGKPHKELTVRYLVPGDEQERSARLVFLDQNADIDLGVARFELSADEVRRFTSAPMDWLALSDWLSERMEVAFVGQGNGLDWNYSTIGNVLSGPPTRNAIAFETGSLQSGFSGGGLFTLDWHLIGIILSDMPPEGMAIPMERALHWAAGKGHPVMLRRRVDVYDFSATPSLAAIGSSVKLNWRTSLGGRCKIEPGVGNVEARGIRDVILNETTRFVLDCEGDGKSVSKEVIVRTKAARISRFTFENGVRRWGTIGMNEDTVGNSVLRWESEDTESCALDGVDAGRNGYRALQLKSKARFVLICKGKGGGEVDSKTLDAEPSSGIGAISIREFRALPSEINTGESVSLNWDVYNSERCILIGDGSSRDVSSLRVPLIVNPTSNSTYRLRCYGTSENKDSNSEDKIVNIKVR